MSARMNKARMNKARMNSAGIKKADWSHIEPGIDSAYRYCEQVTWSQAKNFAYGIRLLDPPRRRALAAVYALARRIDDIGDGPGDPAAKLEQLVEVRKEIEALEEGPGGLADPILVAVADANRRFPIPLGAFLELVEGCEMDCRQTRYRSFDDLVVYCRRVAGSIGRLCLGVFGGGPPEAWGYADSLGVALQVTNICRDVAEDRAMGRLYLPEDDLERFGIDSGLSADPDAFRALILLMASRARQWFREGFRLLDYLDYRSRSCVGAMAGIYRVLLDTIERDPKAVLRGRVSLPAWQKALVVARALLGVSS